MKSDEDRIEELEVELENVRNELAAALYRGQLNEQLQQRVEQAEKDVERLTALIGTLVRDARPDDWTSANEPKFQSKERK